MKKILLILLIAFSSAFAQSVLLLHKGWQLIGATSKITDMQRFDADHVEQIWHYDAVTQKWKGYSPQKEIAKKMRDKGYETIKALESWHGFWIKSKDTWALTLPTDTNSDENITLHKGWNLISLPVNSVVSPHIFDGHTVWKYASKKGWELFESSDTQEQFPTITHITNSDGIWVKSDKEQTISTVSDAAKLHTFKTFKQMQSFIRDMALTHRRPWCGYYPVKVLEAPVAQADMVPAEGKNSISAPAQSVEDSSQTNLQEAGVDEADVIKHNDKAIFFLFYDRRFGQNRIGITTFEAIANGNTQPLHTIPAEGSANDLYIAGEDLIVLSQRTNKYLIDKPEEMIPLHQNDPNSFMIEIFDIRDITDIKKRAKITINGTINSSRIIDGKLYLISRFTPYVIPKYPRIYVDAPECKEYFAPHEGDNVTEIEEGGGETFVPKPVQTTLQRTIVAEEYKKYARCYGLQVDKSGRFYREDYDNPTIKEEHLIPYNEIAGKKEMLITPQTLYTSDKKDQEPVITTVSQIDIAEGKLEKSSSILGYTDTVYASQEGVYLVSTLFPYFYSFDRYEERTALYRFNLGGDLGYDAFGFVKGRVLNQFSLSEYNNTLRIATTIGNSWQGDTDNRLYTLKPIESSLIIQGVLSGLGKKGETIHSVRFMGNRGYIVTFRQTDPFYTLDLSDPTHPKKVGELKVAGFSSYLHPIDGNLILGIGRDATPDGQTAGLKLELFDVSNFAHPRSLDSYTLPGNYTYSEVEHNHKALAYRPSDHLMAFAYQSNDYNYNYPNRRSLLGVYQINADQIAVYTPIEAQEESFYNTFERGLIFDLGDRTYIAYFHNGTISYNTLDRLNKER